MKKVLPRFKYNFIREKVDSDLNSYLRSKQETNKENQILKIYNILFKKFGPQGWWPCPEYHPQNCSFPQNEEEKLEIILGTILTQNTSWKNVEKALKSLKEKTGLNKEKIEQIPEKELAELIRSSGYHNQKAKKIKEYFKKEPKTREELLNTWGIGPETADSILLYAHKEPIFVIDTYTKRIFLRLGFKERSYQEIQELLMKSIPKDYKLYNEYHALLVKLAKENCKTKPKCSTCPLKEKCEYALTHVA